MSGWLIVLAAVLGAGGLAAALAVIAARGRRWFSAATCTLCLLVMVGCAVALGQTPPGSDPGPRAVPTPSPQTSPTPPAWSQP
ncbi:hypothetical protein [Spongiactinospora sp. TRM90649]|uniref:hypothetical protein n=1 Tax=Spongiactinospora sp. TRM90649 TaxID=3031114 RepID=UPI0023F64475|nr:hypothetical protein [Spongiactinospora sp. TRM90649]MDF5755793.1 hypothetical protein [Spongiactinospora sp. TRM90649]